ncbi:MAG: ABC transporter ATP-binding protein [Prevotella sp.]|nr:ABC transporter ATP-binding protein [Prevotella sp.]
MNEIWFENLTIGYLKGRTDAKVVAQELTATLAAGQLTCLLGRNGSGKSTFLRTLAGFQPPLAGTLSGLDGRRENIVSVVLTEQLDLRRLTVSEVVGMGRMPYTNFWGTLREEDHQVVNEAMRLVGIESLSTADFGQLSDGERQKVMIAKALAQQTPIIILDEPTAFLDYPSKRDVMALLALLAHDQQKAILLSTHDVEIARQFADQIWFLDGDSLSTISPREFDATRFFFETEQK